MHQGLSNRSYNQLPCCLVAFNSLPLSRRTLIASVVCCNRRELRQSSRREVDANLEHGELQNTMEYDIQVRFRRFGLQICNLDLINITGAAYFFCRWFCFR